MTQTTAPSKPFAPPRPPDARKLAARILEAVLEGKKTFDDAWAETHGLEKLEPRDRSFCRLLILDTLRYMGFIDSRLRVHMDRLDKTPMPALLALRLGATQLLLLGTPAHAAISTSVDLVPQKITALRGLVNAVLRRLAAEGPLKDKSDVDAPACIPSWLYETWKKDFGAEAAAQIAAASLQEAALDITVKENAAQWAEKLGGKILPTGSVRLPPETGLITGLEGFEDGAWWVQDAAASLPAQLAGTCTGKRVFDLCAAPGGKTAQLAQAGAHVTAVDISASRLQRLKENLARLKLNAEVVESDVLQFKPTEKADIILLDAPCSATGTLRRNPDLMHRKDVGDLSRLNNLQLKMLSHAAGLLASGGRLIYAVCSLQKMEGEDVVEAFLSKNPSFSRLPLQAEEIGNRGEMVTRAGDLRTMPFHLQAEGGMDGFYAARLIKK